MVTYRSVVAAAVALAGTLLASPAWAQVDENAKAIVEQSAAAIVKFQSISFHVKRGGLGALAAFLDAEGDVRFTKTPGTDLRTSPTYFKGLGVDVGKGKAVFEVLLSTAGNEATVTWVDDPANTVYERPYLDQSDGKRLFQQAQSQLLLTDLTSAAPLEKELKAEKLERVAGEKVHDELCDVIKASFDKGQRVFTWWIGVRDRLPRKLQQTNGELTQFFEMWNVKVDEVKPEDMTIPTPKGYKRDVQKAPPPQPVQQQPQDWQIPPPPKPGLSPGTPAPAWELKDADGKPVSLAALKGNVVVMSFWGSVFTQSDKSNAAAQAVADKYKGKNVKVLALACREPSPAAAADAFKKGKYGFPLLPGADDVAKNYIVAGFPTVYVIDADGKVSTCIQGVPAAGTLEKAVETALAPAK